MSKRKAARRPAIVILLILFAAWLAVPIAAQTRREREATIRTSAVQPAGQAAPSGQPTSPPGASPQAPQPPVLTFAPEGLSIEDAVRLTLQNDPDVKLQAEAVRFQEGVVQEQAGPFDSTFLGAAAYNHRVTDLTSDVINTEQANRNNIASSIPLIQNTETTTQATINLLEQARSGPLAGDPLAALAQAAPSLAGTLANFDAILAGLSGASRSALAAARTQFIDSAESSLKQVLVQGQRDLLAAQQQLQDLGPTPTQEVFHDFNFNFQLAKPFRNGLSAAPFFSGDVQGTNFKGKPQAVEFGGNGLGDTYTFEAGLNVFVPLARGRGSRAVDAPERASISDRDASQLTLQYQMSASALRTVLAYWNLRGSQEAVEIANRSVELQNQLVTLTQGLIAAGELPRTELARAQAAQARSLAQLSDSERLQYQARVALATAMGIAATGDSTLPRARDPFPAPPGETDVQPSSTYVSEALSLRPDLSAASKHEQAGLILEQGAETNLRPRIDLNSSTYFTSLGQTGAFESLNRWVGPSETLSMPFEKPLGNNLFGGQLAERRADLSQRTIALIDLTRQIRLNVLQATGSLQDAVAAVRQAEASVEFYRSTIAAEIQRFQIGEATLIDAVQTEQQQTDALLALVNARQILAQLIAQLRFQTGTLLQNGVATRPNLIAVPGPPSRQP